MRIVSENIVVKVSKLVKDDAGDESSLVDEAVLEQLDEVASALVGDGYVVEVTSLGVEG